MKASDTLEHQPTVWPVSYACAQPYHPGSGPMESCFGLVSHHQHGIAVGQQIGPKALCTLPFAAKAGAKHPFKRQHHTTHVGAGGWEPHGSSPTACTGKADQP